MRNWGREDEANSARDGRMDRDVPLPGVIDTIGYGYAALVLRPMALLPIVALELYLLLGPSVAMAPLTDALADALRRQGSNWDASATEVSRLEGFNILEVSTLEIPLLRSPGIVTSFAGEHVSDLRIGASWSNLPLGVVLLLMAGSLLLGLVVAAIYRSLLAQAASAQAGQVYSMAPTLVGRRAVRMGGWILTMVGMSILVAMPVIVVTIVGAILGLGSLTLLWLLLLIPAMWAWVHFYFSIHALVLHDTGPLESMRSSYNVVQQHFWQSLRFIAASLLITSGLSFALRGLATSLPGTLLAIILNAVIASGMIVAAMLFYRDRATRLGLYAQVSEG